MNKLKNSTRLLPALFLAIIMVACKDEPTVKVDIPTEVGDAPQQFPYGHMEATITFACSEDYLNLSLPSFAVLSSTNLVLIQPTREDFKLAEEKSQVSLIENGDTVKSELSVYNYEFNVTLEGYEGALAAFALSTIDENFQENLSEIHELYRGYQNVKIHIDRPNEEFIEVGEISDIIGFKSDDNPVVTMLNVYQLYTQVPTFMLQYTSSAITTKPEFKVGTENLPYEEVTSIFENIVPKAAPGLRFGIGKGEKFGLFNHVEALQKNSEDIEVDLHSVFENPLIKTILMK